MAHQCLKCGHTYADGSAEILKGCADCKGTRFFYTDKPLGTSERERLADQAEIDIERLALGKGVPPPRRALTKDELPLGRRQDWVDLAPENLRSVVEEVVRRATDRTPVFRTGAPAPTVQEYVEAEVPADDILEDLVTPEREREWRREAHADAKPVPLPKGGPARSPSPAPSPSSSPVAASAGPGRRRAEELVYRRSVPTRAARPVTVDGVDLDPEADAQRIAAAMADAVRKAAEPSPASPVRGMGDAAPLPEGEEGTGVVESLYAEGTAPETVAIRGDGIYELDVKRLLEHNPIVIHRDGTYSLHLPSLMEQLGRPRER